MKMRPISPQTWLHGFHINHAIEVTQGQRVLYVSGQTSNDAQGAPMHECNLAAQFELAWHNVVENLRAADMQPANIVRMNFYTTDVDGFMAAIGGFSEVWSKAGCMPVCTLLGVTRLFLPSTMLEIEVTAVA